MRKKLTITLQVDVRNGLHGVIGRRRGARSFRLVTSALTAERQMDWRVGETCARDVTLLLPCGMESFDDRSKMLLQFSDQMTHHNQWGAPIGFPAHVHEGGWMKRHHALAIEI